MCPLNRGNSTVKVVSYTYDALGRRTQKVVVDSSAPNNAAKSFTRRYGYDGSQMLFEFDEMNNVLARYTASTLASDDVLSVKITSNGATAGLAQNAGSYLYLKDTMGSVTDITNSTGTRLQHYIYSAFGMLLGIQDASAADISSSPVLSTSIGFTGRELDSESGLMYYRARYYDPSIGRFLQEDPQPGKLSIPASVVNRYIYSGNNPWNITDPSGQSWLGDLFAGIGIGILTVLSGGTILGALAAIGSVAGGSLVAAMAQAAFQGGNFWENVGKNFDTNFMIGVAFLGVGTIAADLFGGGVASAGGNGLNGWVSSNDTFGVPNGGGLTIGSATAFSGANNGLIMAHEFGHTLQFIGLSALSGAVGTGSAGAWSAYAGLGGLGAAFPSGAGAWWENMASNIGW